MNALYNVRDDGATGQGSVSDTKAIQSGIDRCNAAGGGTVLVPAGVYACGTIYLKDNVCLYLDAGAVIKANPADQWNAPDCFPENSVSVMEKADGRHLIIGYKLKNVSMAGRGVVDGNYTEFYAGVNEHGRAIINGTRPSQMVYFCDCEDVSVRDIHLLNSSYWSLFIHGCRNVLVDGVYAYTAPEIWCGDGVDIDACQNVCVSNCIIDTEDDCLTLRCNNKRFDPPRDCENVTVTNCHLKSTYANAIRVGVGDGIIRNALFNNIIAKSGIHICGRYSSKTAGTAIENIIFSNVNLESRRSEAFFISCGYHSQRRCANIMFSNMQIRTESCSYIGGMPDNITEGIVFKDVNITMLEGDLQNDPEKLDLIEEIWGKSNVYCRGSSGAPFALWIEHARNCRFTDCSITLEDKKDVWLSAVRMNNTQNMDTQSLKLDGFEKSFIKSAEAVL